MKNKGKIDFDAPLNKYDVQGISWLEIVYKYGCLRFGMQIEVMHEN